MPTMMEGPGSTGTNNHPFMSSSSSLPMSDLVQSSNGKQQHQHQQQQHEIPPDQSPPSVVSSISTLHNISSTNNNTNTGQNNNSNNNHTNSLKRNSPDNNMNNLSSLSTLGSDPIPGVVVEGLSRPSGHSGNGPSGSGPSPTVKKRKKMEVESAGGGAGSAAIPIFVQKTYDMIQRCETNVEDSKIACWSEDGESFVIKDQDLFGKTIIPLYFDHNKFSSFKRQLYNHGFRKVQNQLGVRDAEEFNVRSTKWVTFFNANFKRNRPELLPNINRCTQSVEKTNAVAVAAMAATNIEKNQQKKSIEHLEGRVAYLESQNSEMTNALHSLINTIQSMQDQLKTALAPDMVSPSTGGAPAAGAGSSGGGGVVHEQREESAYVATTPTNSRPQLQVKKGNATPRSAPAPGSNPIHRPDSPVYEYVTQPQVVVRKEKPLVYTHAPPQHVHSHPHGHGPPRRGPPPPPTPVQVVRRVEAPPSRSPVYGHRPQMVVREENPPSGRSPVYDHRPRVVVREVREGEHHGHGPPSSAVPLPQYAPRASSEHPMPGYGHRPQVYVQEEGAPPSKAYGPGPRQIVQYIVRDDEHAPPPRPPSSSPTYRQQVLMREEDAPPGAYPHRTKYISVRESEALEPGTGPVPGPGPSPSYQPRHAGRPQGFMREEDLYVPRPPPPSSSSSHERENHESVHHPPASEYENAPVHASNEAREGMKSSPTFTSSGAPPQEERSEDGSSSQEKRTMDPLEMIAMVAGSVATNITQ